MSIPTYAKLVARAEALLPRLRARAPLTEELRRMPDDTLADLHASGLFRMLQPRSVGGSELPYRALIELGSIVGRACGSTSWVLANLASHHWMLAMWPPAAQDEVWCASPDTLVGSALVFPSGHATRVPGGYRLSGHWRFSSGIDSCTWNMLGGVVAENDIGVSEHRIFLLPRADYRTLDTWFAAGLKGTGSKDVEADDVFVPEHRSVLVDALKGGSTPGAERHPSALYRIPVFDMFAYVVAAPALGIAQGAVADFTAETRSRITAYSATRMADYASTHARLGEAAAAVDTARLLLLDRCDAVTRTAETGGVPELEDKTRLRRDGAYAARLCIRAVDLLFEAGGGEALFDDRPIQRSFRDIHAAGGHYALIWDIAAATYGRVALGLPPENPTL